MPGTLLGNAMRRREFIALLGGVVVAWAPAARAQQPKMPTIGYLSSSSEGQVVAQSAAFRRGLSEVGFSEPRNVIIDFRWAEGRYERLPGMVG